MLPWCLSADSDSSVSLHRTSGQRAEPPASSSPDPPRKRTSENTGRSMRVEGQGAHRQSDRQEGRQAGTYLVLGTGNHSIYHTPTGQVGYKTGTNQHGCGVLLLWQPVHLCVRVYLLGCLLVSSVRLGLFFPGEPWTQTDIYTEPPGCQQTWQLPENTHTHTLQPSGWSLYLSGDASLNVRHELRAEAGRVASSSHTTSPVLLFLHTAVNEVDLLQVHICSDRQTNSQTGSSPVW